MKIICTGGSGFIGTHLMEYFISKGLAVINVDIKSPQKDDHIKYWQQCDIMDYEKLRDIFTQYQPTHVVHLAARVTMDGKTLDDFKENTDGTRNLLMAIKNTPNVSRIIITSTQHVRKPGSPISQSDEDYKPLGLYGESKVITEQLTRHAELACAWTIIRPTNIWGPRNNVLKNSIWRIIKKGLFIYPRIKPVIRSYGYVSNIIWQIEKILLVPEIVIKNKVFYVGDAPSDQLDWLNAFSNVMTGKKVKIVPKSFIYSLAIIGDLLSAINIKFPMNTERYRNLTTNNPVPVQLTIDTFGQPPYSINEGIEKTVSWLINERWI